MVFYDIFSTNISDSGVLLPANFVIALGKLGLLLQALGVSVILWLVFHIISFLYNQRRMNEIYAIKKDMVRIEGKIDEILKKVN